MIRFEPLTPPHPSQRPANTYQCATRPLACSLEDIRLRLITFHAWKITELFGTLLLGKEISMEKENFGEVVFGFMEKRQIRPQKLYHDN